MSDCWLNVSALSFPRRQAIVRLNEVDLFQADVPVEVLMPQWAEARNEPRAREWIEKVARHLATSAGAPADCSLVAIAYSYARATVEIVVAHPSFDIVPEGAEVPVLALS